MQNGKQHTFEDLIAGWVSVKWNPAIFLSHFNTQLISQQVPVILKACTQHGKHFSQTHQCPSSTRKTLLNTFYLHYVTYFWVKQYIQWKMEGGTWFYQTGFDWSKADNTYQNGFRCLEETGSEHYISQMVHFLNGDNYSEVLLLILFTYLLWLLLGKIH